MFTDVPSVSSHTTTNPYLFASLLMRFKSGVRRKGPPGTSQKSTRYSDPLISSASRVSKSALVPSADRLRVAPYVAVPNKEIVLMVSEFTPKAIVRFAEG